MNDCLAITVKSSINDDNVEKLGVLCIKRIQVTNETANDAYIGIDRSSIEEGSSVILTIVGDGHFSNTYGGAALEEPVVITKSSGIMTLYTSNGNYTIEVENKYDFNVSIANVSKTYEINMTDTYWTKIAQINAPCYVGNLAKLNPEKITNVTLKASQKTKIEYTTEDIEKLTLLTTLNIPENFPLIKMESLGKLVNLTGTNQISSCEGDIVDFVHAQRENGRTSFDGTLDFKWLGVNYKVKFNGTRIVYNQEHGYITWTATTITFRDETITA